MTKEAKIIALTCTHAALKRKDMVDLMFRVCGEEGPVLVRGRGHAGEGGAMLVREEGSCW